MNLNPTLYHDERKLNTLAALFLFVLTATLLFLSLTPNSMWGDDFAAYISEGIAIAEGRFDEQVRLNYIMHTASLPEEATDGRLVYVWGYPLLHALTYLLVGFDTVGFSSLIYYKISGVLAAALLAVVMFFFLRRRFGRGISFTLSLIFCVCYELRECINFVLSEPLFLFCAMLSLLLVELFLEAGASRRRTAYGVLLGAVLWYTYEVRLNGVSILFACAAACVILIISRREYKRPRALLIYLLPFAVFLVLKLASESVLSAATGNTSDVGGISVQRIMQNAVYYAYVAREWMRVIWIEVFVKLVRVILFSYTSVEGGIYGDIWGASLNIAQWCARLTYIVCLVGIVFDGFRRENLHLFLFAVVYFLVLILLPYEQGMRYLIPVMLILPMYFAYGFRRILSLLPRKWRDARAYVIVGGVAAVLACTLVSVTVAREGISARNSYDSASPQSMSAAGDECIYTPASVEVFRYISANTPEDSVIAFIKPRALYLNTRRVAFRPDVNGHEIADADYYLVGNAFAPNPAPPDNFEPCFENSGFVLYKKRLHVNSWGRGKIERNKTQR